ncbi:MAG: hypothetical protein ABSC22_06805 [Roseiarcus sp.]|jgi:hypothetical protein
MMRFPIALLAVLAMSCGLAHAQLVLPGAAARTPPGPPAEASVPRKPEKPTAAFASSVAAVVGRPLRLNGDQGQLLFSGRGRVLRIDKFSLPGEVISDSSRKCLIDIVGEAPIETKSLGRPDGLERYEAEIPACPFSFDVLDGAVLVPAQNAACVFQAADCQASPAGLWGAEGAGLEGDAKSIERERARADAAASESLRALEARLKGRPEAADIARQDNGFPARRDDVCRDYVKEAVHGYCASRMAQARAALLQERIEALDRRPAGQD